VNGTDWAGVFICGGWGAGQELSTWGCHVWLLGATWCLLLDLAIFGAGRSQPHGRMR
jgi:hypothetical protein